MAVAVNLPPQIVNVVQSGLLERAFHDALFPALQYRAEALREEWPANTGQEIIETRASLLLPTDTPMIPGQDPTPDALSYEQWVVAMVRYGKTMDTHMPTARTALADIFLRNIQQQGLQAGQSINRVARNALFKAYLSGHSNLIVAALAADTSIRISSLNGFTDVIILSQNGPNPTARPVPISPTTPLPITVGTIAANAISFAPDNPSDPLGPGTLQLAAALGGGGAPNRSPVTSSVAPEVIYSGGGSSVDDISGADTITLQDIINAAAALREDNVQPHDTGFFHAHISSKANAQVFADPVFQRLNQSLPEHVTYKEGFLGTIGGVCCFMNTESPNDRNSGALTPTFGPARYAAGIGSEVINAVGGGVRIGSVLVTGKGSLYERYFDESQYISEAGVTGKIGEFDVVNNGLQIVTDLIRLYLRAPIDRLGDIVSSTWSITTSYPVPTDIGAPTSPARYKRAKVIRHALF